MKSNDKMRVEVPLEILTKPPYTTCVEDWKDFIKTINGKEVTLGYPLIWPIAAPGAILSNKEPGWKINTPLLRFSSTGPPPASIWDWVPEKWLKPLTNNSSCRCDLQKLMCRGCTCGAFLAEKA